MYYPYEDVLISNIITNNLNISPLAGKTENFNFDNDCFGDSYHIRCKHPKTGTNKNGTTDDRYNDIYALNKIHRELYGIF